MKITSSIVFFFLFSMVFSQTKIENLTNISLSKIYNEPDDGACNSFLPARRRKDHNSPAQKRDSRKICEPSQVSAGCSDEAAVRYLLTVEGEKRPATEALEVGWLDRYQRPLPVMKEYDALLAAEVAR